MAISFVGSATGTTSATLPAHQAGDLIIIFAFRDGNSTPATLPAGYTQITTRATNTAGGISGYKIAASSSETSGTWTNATGIIVGVYRGSAGTMTVGGSVTAGGASTTVSYAAVMSVNTNYNSWWVGVAGHRSTNTNLQNPPTNMTNRASLVDATDELALHDTNGTALTAWTARTVSVSGTSSGWSAAVIEIYETIADGTSPISLLGVAAKVTSTGTTITPDRTTGSLSGVSYQAGDVFVLSIASWTSGSGMTSMSADWTREANISTTNGPTMAVWWHRYDGVTMPSFTATYSASDTAMVAGLAAFRGVKSSGSPWNVTWGSFSNSYPMALTPITTTVGGCRILAISGEDGIEDYPEPTGPWSSSIWTDGGGVGNFQHDNAGNGAAIAAWHYAQTTAGSTLGLALILNGTGFGVRHWMGALEPAVSSGTTYDQAVTISAGSTVTRGVATGKLVAVTSSSTLVRAVSVGKKPGITSAGSVSAVKSAARSLAVSAASTLSAVKSVSRSLSASSASTVSAIASRAYLVAASISSSAVAALVKTVGRKPVITGPASVSLRKAMGKGLSLSSGGSVAASAVRAFLISLSIGASSSVALVKSTGKRIAVSSSGAVSIRKALALSLSVTASATVSARKTAGKALAVGSAASASLSRSIGKAAAMSSSSAISARKAVGAQVQVSATSVVASVKSLSLAVSVASGSVVSASKTVGSVAAFVSVAVVSSVAQYLETRVIEPAAKRIAAASKEIREAVIDPISRSAIAQGISRVAVALGLSRSKGSGKRK